MDPLLAQLLILATVLVVVFYVTFWPRLRRRHIQSRPFPADWLGIIRARLPFYDTLPPELQGQMQNLIKEFLHDKHFVGCAGQHIDDRIRVTIAAQACLLLLNRPGSCYSELRSILVYPSAFVARHEVVDDLGLVSTHHSELLGESWSQGKVVLAWDSVEHGVMNLRDGENVVLHEFAHQLDHESGDTNGVPRLDSLEDGESWSRVFSEEFEKLQREVEALDGDPLRGSEVAVLDYYGATDPAEFFAVATEAFFERPDRMKQRHPALFEQLKHYYRLDPVSWQPWPPHRQPAAGSSWSNSS